MNKIVFLLSKMPPKKAIEKFTDEMAQYAVEVEVSGYEKVMPNEGTLLVTDSASLYGEIKALGMDAIIYIESTDEMDGFSGAKYFVMDAFETDYEYYLRVYERFMDIPWTISMTDRLIMRETIESDVDKFYEIYKNPEMCRYTEALYEDVEEEKKYVREYRRSVYEVQGYGIWTLIFRETGEIIGRAGLISRSGFDGAEVGFAIAPDFQGQGLAKEAVTECLRLSKLMELTPVNALVMRENEKSIRVLKSCGFRMKEETVVNNVNYLVYSIDL